ncbi:MAG TPA: hypothetical protein VE990_03085 [Acidimicrobiales bacterium]|nr:hypothetical protein [Acidimicrobiales bacterium]
MARADLHLPTPIDPYEARAHRLLSLLLLSQLVALGRPEEASGGRARPASARRRGARRSERRRQPVRPPRSC